MASTTPLTSFHVRLRQARRAAHLTQRVAAQVAGVARVTITHYEAGRVAPPIAAAVSLARLYRVSVDWLVGLRQCNQRTQRKDTIVDANLTTTQAIDTREMGLWTYTGVGSKGGETMGKTSSKAAPKKKSASKPTGKTKKR